MCIRDRVKKVSVFFTLELHSIQPGPKKKTNQLNINRFNFLAQNLLIKSRDITRPVSYTHLDVYKRQVLRKLKIALSLDDTAMLEIFDLVGFHISKHEISAFFRNPTNSHYRDCKDQILRNFLVGLQMKFRPGEGEEND